MKKILTTLLAIAILSTTLFANLIFPSAYAQADLLENYSFSNLPSEWSYNSETGTISGTTALWSDPKYFFGNLSLDTAKTYIFKTTVNFSQLEMYGSVRFLFRFSAFDACQSVYIQPGEGVTFGTDYWRNTGYGAASPQPQFQTNTDYEVTVVTAPSTISVFIDGNIVFSKTGLTAAGTQIGIAAMNSTFTMRNFSLTEREADPTNLLDNVVLSSIPSGWSYNDLTKTIKVDTLAESQVPFSNVTLDAAKTYIYRFTANINNQNSNGSIRVMFRFGGFTNTQMLYIQPGYGLIYGTDYWCGSNFTNGTPQPSFALNTDYDIAIITAPNSVSVYVDGVQYIYKTGVATTGLQVGLASSNVKFTMGNISLKEKVADPTNMLDSPSFSAPADWSYNALNNGIDVNTFTESQVPFTNVSLNAAKTYIYKFTLNFKEVSTNGSARLMIRYGGFGAGDTQMLYVQPGLGLIYGNDYWCYFVTPTYPSPQPAISLNSDIDITVVTAPDYIKVYVGEQKFISKTGISSTGVQMGLACSNAKFSMKNISLREAADPFATSLSAYSLNAVSGFGEVMSELPSDITVGQFLNSVTPGYDDVDAISVKDSSGTAVVDQNTKLVTGFKATITIGTVTKDIYYINYGDLNSDSVVNIVDLLNAKEMVIQNLTEKTVQTVAADIDKTGILDVADLIAFRNKLLGK